MPTPHESLRSATHVVVKDYPSRSVPDALTSAGLLVTVYDGPSEADVVVSELSDGTIRRRQGGLGNAAHRSRGRVSGAGRNVIATSLVCCWRMK